MKYSVLMSVYKKDSAAYLDIALRSIYDNQTKKPDEIVVVFDGPLTEELYTVLENFKAGKEDLVKYYPQQENKGLGEALRIGSGYCTGDYIFRMDSDDISKPQRFEKQSAYVESHPEIDVLGTDIAEFKNNPEEKNKTIRSIPANHTDIVYMSTKRNPMNHMSVCIKKSSLEKCGGYKPLLLLEDYYLWLRMMTYGCKFANIKEPLVYVRVGTEFYYKRGAKERIYGWKVLQDYMVECGMINKFSAKKNMIYIRGFVNSPSWIKKILYTRFLRKQY